jgi:hypothetical protein
MTSRSTWGTKIINKDVIRIKIVNGMWKMNPSMQQPRTFTCLSKSIYKTREHYVNNWKKINKKIKRMLKRN